MTTVTSPYICKAMNVQHDPTSMPMPPSPPRAPSSVSSLDNPGGASTLGVELLMNQGTKRGSDSDDDVPARHRLFDRDDAYRHQPPHYDVHKTDEDGADTRPDAEEDTRSEGRQWSRPGRLFATDSDSDRAMRHHEIQSGIERVSNEDLLNLKREMLYRFDRMEKKGMRLPRKFTLSSSYDDMKHEYERLKRDREVDNSVMFQRRMLMTVVSGVEFLNNRYDPFDLKLDGWSENVHDGIGDYDDIFEELHEKYKGKSNLPPEIKLVMTLGGSAFMFHLTNTLFKSTPDAKRIFRENPDLARQFASATAATMAQDATQSNDGFASGVAGMFQGMFNSPMPTRPPQPQHPPAAQTSRMNGPGDLETIFQAAREKSNTEVLAVPKHADATQQQQEEDDLDQIVEIFSDHDAVSEASSDATKMPDSTSVLVATRLTKTASGRGRSKANAAPGRGRGKKSGPSAALLDLGA